MLVLTRKRNEMINIGDQVVIKVIHTSKGAVKIGIEAPRNMRVLRGELVDKRAEGTVGADDLDSANTSATSMEDEFEIDFDSEDISALGDQFPLTIVPVMETVA